MFTIQNNILKVSIASKGAELQSILHLQNGLEYMWSGDAKFWGKKSPVLFPIVGGLKNNSYQYGENNYPLSRHGFARDMDFTAINETGTSVEYSLHSNEETKNKYPFDFSFSVIYTLEENNLNVTYKVINKGNDEMYFSVGGHPAFKLPLTDETTFEDYYLEFNKVENAGRWPLSADGLIEATSAPLLNNTNKLPLQKQLFYEDALVFKQLNSTAISIRTDKHDHGLTVKFDGFPYMGIWNAKDADFLCIEPWCGIADSVNASGKLDEKEGINTLSPGGIFERTWMVEIF